MKRRFTALLLAFLLAAVGLCGCGEEEKPAQITLRSLSILGDEAEKPIYTALLEAYSAEHPEVYHVGTLAQSAFAYKLDATFERTYTASRYPHIVCYFTDTGIDEVSEYFVSVEEIRERYPDFAASVSQSAFDSVRSEDGKCYCVPLLGQWTAMVVNPSLFARYGLALPTTWQELLRVCGVFSARGITPIANPPEDCASILETLLAAAGGSESLSDVLDGTKGGSDPAVAAAWNAYLELCGVNAFPKAAVSDELSEYLDPPTETVSGGDVVSDSQPPIRPTEPSRPIDALELFGSGEAAMVVLDRSQLGQIALEDFTVIGFPVSGMTEDSEPVFIGGFNVGFYLTRRAFDDANARDAAVAFIDRMTGSEAAEAFSALGYLTAAQVDGAADAHGLAALSRSDWRFMFSTRSSVTEGRYAALGRIAAAVSSRIIAPEQAAVMSLDAAVTLGELVPPPTAEPQGTQDGSVSPTDAVPVK